MKNHKKNWIELTYCTSLERIRKINTILVLFIILFFLITQNSFLIVCIGNKEPTSASYYCTLDLDGNANMDYITTLNNSANRPAIFDVVFDFWTETNITNVFVEKDEGEFQSYIEQIENGTHIHVFASDLPVGAYGVRYFSCNWQENDVLEIKYGDYILKLGWDSAVDVTQYIVQIPKYAPHKYEGKIVEWGLNQCVLKEICPYPDFVFDDAEYINLVWSQPTYVLENGLNKFKPLIVFSYEYDEDPILHAMPEILESQRMSFEQGMVFFGLGLIGGFSMDFIFEWCKRKFLRNREIEDIKKEIDDVQTLVKSHQKKTDRSLNRIESRIGEVYREVKRIEEKK